MTEQAQRPNILFIIDDQHRWDYLQAMHPWLRTPNLQRLMDQGLSYNHCYSSNPLCMPARYSLHNGLYGHQSGMNQNIGDWNFDIPTLPRTLQNVGYHTAMIGKCHAHEAIPTNFDLRSQQAHDDIAALGYDHVDQVSGKSFSWFIECPYTQHLRQHGQLDVYRNEAQRLMDGGAAAPSVIPNEYNIDMYITDRTVNWLEQYEDEKPFFLWAGLCAPHDPLDPPEELADYYRRCDIPEPIGEKPYGVTADEQALYAGQVELIDQQVGRILDALEASGKADNTLVIFCSDHGELLGDHHKRGKCEPWEASIRVPCIMRWPRHIPEGKTTDAMIELVDLTATMASVGTGENDITQYLPASPGQPLVEHWQSHENERRDYIWAEDGGQFGPGHPAFQMVRTRDWKYTFYPDGGTDGETELLFNMDNDPNETHDLSDDGDYLATRQDMNQLLLKHLALTMPPRWR